MIKSFECPSCNNGFSLPVEKISSQGSKGKCKSCGKTLLVFPDGRSVLAEAEMPASAPSPAKEDPPIWQLRLRETQIILKPGSFTLANIREMIIDGKLTLDDEAMITGAGNWLPLKAYSAMDSFWADKALKEREEYGDLDHCVGHQNVESKWRCPKCLKFFCDECVLNKPFIQGGEAHFVCKTCEMDLMPLKRKGSGFGSLLGSLKTKK
jgi:hypothetical protein